MKKDRFIFLLIGFVVIAYLFPHYGRGWSGSIIDIISNLGILLILFFNGVRLSAEKIKSGLRNWKLHVLVQTTTFLIFPLLALILYPFVEKEEHETIWLGLFFMASLPSTISFSVIMVSIAKGNIPAAIFNATIAGIIGIVVTPLWIGLFLHHTRLEFDLTEIYLKLMLQIIIPLLAGVLLHKKCYSYSLKINKQLNLFNKIVILLIVFKSFSKSFNESVFQFVQIVDLFLIAVIIVMLFFAVNVIVHLITGLLLFSREDRITALFCGSQKSLIHGTIFSNVLFGGHYSAGILLLPLMLFHLLQIFVSNIMADRYGRQNNMNVPSD